MLPEDMNTFNIQVLRIVATLYKAMPRTMHVQIPIATGSQQNDKDISSFASGTITWLHRNIYVTGTLHPSGAIINAQLSALTYGVLQKQEQNAPELTFGELVLDAASQPASQDEATVSELLVRRLLGDLTFGANNLKLPLVRAGRPF
jgi:hypothetical protein